jgi:hypothetical protein
MTCFARAYAFLANVELCVGAERQRDHALTTLRLKPTTYVVDGGSDRRFMTFLVEPAQAGLMNGQHMKAYRTIQAISTVA